MRGLDAADLVDIVTSWDPGMPVRPMEELVALGDEALPAILSAVQEWDSDPEDDVGLLWLLVLLGLLGGDEAVPVLVGVLLDENASRTHRGVAAEALGRIGRPAVPPLVSALDEAAAARHWVYAALGYTRDPEARGRLLDALAGDPEHTGMIACALAEYGRPEDVHALAGALERCPTPQRPDLEEAIQRAHAGGDEKEVEDWRLRYRIDPRWGVPLPSQPHILSVLAELRADDEPPPVRSLEEILADEPEEERRCEECGEPLRSFTGVLTCPEQAVSVATAQHALLGSFREEWDVDDLFDLLDEAEEEQAVLESLRDESGVERDDLEERAEDLRFVRLTASWMIEQGVESVGRARAYLLARSAQLAREHGDPHGLLERRRARGAAGGRGVGRNDPCPCGSGRKYKKCCGRPGGDAGSPSGGRRRGDGSPEGVVSAPTLQTAEGDSLVIARAHFEVLDAAEVRARLDAYPSLGSTEDDGWVWLQDDEGADESVRRILGWLRLEPNRLTLETMSRSRLDDGRRLIEAALGELVSHRADTVQDALRAAADAPRRRAAPDPLVGIPPEEREQLLQQILDRQYRDWPDEPIPALGGRTPREAVRTAEGRQAVADLLHSYEEAPGPVGSDPSFRYDFGWMWKELGLEEMR